jgi:hypothetical protein
MERGSLKIDGLEQELEDTCESLMSQPDPTDSLSCAREIVMQERSITISLYGKVHNNFVLGHKSTSFECV